MAVIGGYGAGSLKPQNYMYQIENRSKSGQTVITLLFTEFFMAQGFTL